MEKKDRIDLVHQKKQGLGTIRVPRLYAQEDIRIPEKHKIPVVKKNGEIIYKSPITINDEKIADTCIQIFQQSDLAKEYSYDILRKKALENLEEKFNQYNLIISEDMEKNLFTEIEKKREIAIAQWIRDYIEKELDIAFNVDFDTFMKATGIKSIERTKDALRLLNSVQSKIIYEYKTERIKEDFSEIYYRFTTVTAIPEISIDIDKEVGKDITSIKEYLSLDIRNKRQYIKGLIIKISPAYLSAVLGLGRDYTTLQRKQRDKFTSSYTFKLDALIRSIEKVQYTNINNFTIDTFQNKMGTDFAEYKALKRAVIIPAIENINEHTDLIVELIEHKKGKKVVSISFGIKRK